MRYIKKLFHCYCWAVILRVVPFHRIYFQLAFLCHLVFYKRERLDILLRRSVPLLGDKCGFPLRILL